jgi:hypothetical protein
MVETCDNRLVGWFPDLELSISRRLSGNEIWRITCRSVTAGGLFAIPSVQEGRVCHSVTVKSTEPCRVRQQPACPAGWLIYLCPVLGRWQRVKLGSVSDVLGVHSVSVSKVNVSCKNLIANFMKQNRWETHLLVGRIVPRSWWNHCMGQ